MTRERPYGAGRAVKLSTRLHAQQLRLEQLQITTREPPTSDSDAERPDTVHSSAEGASPEQSHRFLRLRARPTE